MNRTKGETIIIINRTRFNAIPSVPRANRRQLRVHPRGRRQDERTSMKPFARRVTVSVSPQSSSIIRRILHVTRAQVNTRVRHPLPTPTPLPGNHKGTEFSIFPRYKHTLQVSIKCPRDSLSVTVSSVSNLKIDMYTEIILQNNLIAQKFSPLRRSIGFHQTLFSKFFVHTVLGYAITLFTHPIERVNIHNHHVSFSVFLFFSLLFHNIPSNACQNTLSKYLSFFPSRTRIISLVRFALKLKP